MSEHTIARERMQHGVLTSTIGLRITAAGEPDDAAADRLREAIERSPGAVWIAPSGPAAVAPWIETVIYAAGRLPVVASIGARQLARAPLCTYLQITTPREWIGATPEDVLRGIDGAEAGGLAGPDEILVPTEVSVRITPRWLDDLWAVLAWGGRPVGTILTSHADARMVDAVAEAQTPWRIQERR